MASAGDTMVPGEEKNREHWRFISVQARGCLAVTRRSDKQREQQLQLAGYLALRECEVIGIGDTRLGGDASELSKLMRAALRDTWSTSNDTAGDEATGTARPRPNRTCDVVYNDVVRNNVNSVNDASGSSGLHPDSRAPGGNSPESLRSNIYDDTIIHSNTNNDDDEGAERPHAGRRTSKPRPRVGLTCDAAGSHKTANDIWRGGVLLGSQGEATKRMQSRIDDCRGWGRYVGRIYRGAAGKTMVVVETYFPDAQYDNLDATREDYSQMLGARAATAPDGVPALR